MRGGRATAFARGFCPRPPFALRLALALGGGVARCLAPPPASSRRCSPSTSLVTSMACALMTGRCVSGEAIEAGRTRLITTPPPCCASLAPTPASFRVSTRAVSLCPAVPVRRTCRNVAIAAGASITTSAVNHHGPRARQQIRDQILKLQILVQQVVHRHLVNRLAACWCHHEPSRPSLHDTRSTGALPRRLRSSASPLGSTPLRRTCQ